MDIIASWRLYREIISQVRLRWAHPELSLAKPPSSPRRPVPLRLEPGSVLADRTAFGLPAGISAAAQRERHLRFLSLL